MGIAATVVGWVVLGAVALLSYASTAGQVEQNTKDIGDHESRIRANEKRLESDIAEIKSDIKYLRRDAEQRE